MISFDDVLWKELADMRIAPPGSVMSFEARLGSEQGWNAAFTCVVMQEYRRFLYLATTAGHAVSPSKLVDAAWHLHLTYSRHYWEDLCGQILRRPLHHEPSAGGRVEAARLAMQYRETLRSYRAIFGCDAPTEIWPDPDDAPPTVSRNLALGGLGVATMLVAACGSATAIRSEHWLPIVLLVAAFVGLFIVLRFKQDRSGKNDGSCGAGCGGGDSSCGGGCGGD